MIVFVAELRLWRGSWLAALGDGSPQILSLDRPEKGRPNHTPRVGHDNGRNCIDGIFRVQALCCVVFDLSHGDISTRKN